MTTFEYHARDCFQIFQYTRIKARLIKLYVIKIAYSGVKILTTTTDVYKGCVKYIVYGLARGATLQTKVYLVTYIVLHCMNKSKRHGGRRLDQEPE